MHRLIDINRYQWALDRLREWMNFQIDKKVQCALYPGYDHADHWAWPHKTTQEFLLLIVPTFDEYLWQCQLNGI